MRLIQKRADRETVRRMSGIGALPLAITVSESQVGRIHPAAG